MGEVVYRSFARHAVTVRNPDAVISRAADLALADRLRACGEAICNHLERTEQPLTPHDRARLMRAVAMLRDQPL